VPLPFADRLALLVQREVGRLLGPAEWDGEDAKRLIRAMLK